MKMKKIGSMMAIALSVLFFWFVVIPVEGLIVLVLPIFLFILPSVIIWRIYPDTSVLWLGGLGTGIIVYHFREKLIDLYNGFHDKFSLMGKVGNFIDRMNQRS